MDDTLNFDKQLWIFVRHGQADHNTQQVYNSNPSHPNYLDSHLTEQGKKEVLDTIYELKKCGLSSQVIEKCWVSPLPRTLQTLELFIQNKLVDEKVCTPCELIMEWQVGDLEGGPVIFQDHPEKAKLTKEHCESDQELNSRLQEMLILLSQQEGHQLIISHKSIIETLLDSLGHKKTSVETGGFFICERN